MGKGTSTKAAGRRSRHDTYLTRTEVALATIEEVLSSKESDYYWGGRVIRVLGLGMGIGVWELVVREFFERHDIPVHITAIELERAYVKPPWVDKLIYGRVPDVELDDEFDIVISNPPFKQAMEFIKYGHAHLRSDGVQIYLLPNDFPCAQERFVDLGPDGLYTPAASYTLVGRPSFYSMLLDMIPGAFNPRGTDGHNTSIFVFDRNGEKRKVWPAGFIRWMYEVEVSDTTTKLQMHENMAVYRAIFEASRTLFGPVLDDGPSLLAARIYKGLWFSNYATVETRLLLRMKVIEQGLTSDCPIVYTMPDGKQQKFYMVTREALWNYPRVIQGIPLYDYSLKLDDQWTELRTQKGVWWE